MADTYKIIHPAKYFRDYLHCKIRPDGREFNGFRPIALNINATDSADGSAVVKIGKTNVICGIRAELTKPKNNAPETGFLIPNVILPSICSTKYRDHGFNVNSKTIEESDVFSCALYDILKNSEFIDLNELCIYKEKLVWAIYCDAVVINHDGGIIDASLIAICAALKNLKLPKVTYDPEINKIDVNITIKNSLNVGKSPIATSLMVFEDNIILTDPTAEEEDLASSLVTIVSCNSKVCYILKPGGTPLDQKDLELCTKTALAREKSMSDLKPQK